MHYSPGRGPSKGKNMNESFENAVRRLEALPDSQQAEAAEFLRLFVSVLEEKQESGAQDEAA